ncbi:MAG: bifunctional N-acetylglucosamine-1-phosphate uridyltransferase/glucosamine-1-phosphate acetyltransferase [Actinomycetota bacterium]
MPVYAIILAAGEGTRMQSSRPIPLHLLCGQEWVIHVITALKDLTVDKTSLVVGHGAKQVTSVVAKKAPKWAKVSFVEQKVQRGTGDATIVGLSAIDLQVGASSEISDTSTVIVMPGDTPLLKASTISTLVNEHQNSNNAATLLTAYLDSPTGYGRIVRAKDDRILKVVEERDATPEIRTISEVNTSIYAFRRDLLGPALRRISNKNSQSEYYLTDVVEVLAGMGHRVGSHTAVASEVSGVNDRWQLAMAERELRSRTNNSWLMSGVTMFDPQQTFIDVTVKIGKDVTLLPGTILQGETIIGDGCEIGPNSRLVNTRVGQNSRVDNTIARDSTIGKNATVGPFANLAPNSTVADEATTGSFYDGSQ